MLSVPEVAARLNRSRDTVYRLIYNGQLPAYRQNGRLYVEEHALLLAPPDPPVHDEPRPVRLTELPDDDRRYLTAAETAGILRCTTAWVRQLVREGHLTANRNIGRNSTLRIHPGSVRDYMDRKGMEAKAS